MISRNPDDYQRETNEDIYKGDLSRLTRLFATEYTRALNATKLERVFAKPFVASLDGHVEGVHILTKHPSRPSVVLSGARDGQVKVWALARRQCLATFQTHCGPFAFSLNSFLGVAHAVSHLANSSHFVTCGDGVTVWSSQGTTRIREYDVGHDTAHVVRANPIEEAVLVGAMSDRSIFVIDTRQAVALKKVTMKLRPNMISWNPLEAYTFTVASDDYNLYTFDMRYLDSPKFIHSGHTAAVIDLDYSPTGQEIVSGSFDRSLRIFRANESRSRYNYVWKGFHISFFLEGSSFLQLEDCIDLLLWSTTDF
uniref:WD_REPEATS_REGION domain-containing protein n=1 Tax=Angiostrongylus cantonensis TaxID=6313 RepID=A0A0K0D273_ANGCA